MTSEERVSKLLSEPIRVEDFRTALINLLNEHAAEAVAEHAESVRDTFEAGYAQGHDETVEGCARDFEEASAEHMKWLEEKEDEFS